MKSNKLKMGGLSFIVFLFLYSCEVEKIEPAQPVPDKEETLPSDTTGKPEKPGEVKPEKPDVNTEIVGNGSGSINIKNVEDKNYTVEPGAYWTITFENVKNITLNGLDKVKIVSGDMYISNVNGLTIKGITFENYSQAAINIENSANNLTLENIKFKNIKNTVIKYNINKKYDGSAASFSENIHLINIEADNIGTLFGSGGGLSGADFHGLIKGFKFTGSKITNSPGLGNGIYLGLAEDYEISNNIVDNVNSSNNNHNGIFHITGNGKLFGNKVTNHQGNMVRAWIASTTKPNALVEIYDNIVYNSTRYSAFELQVTPSMENQSAFKPANAKVYNNTAGRLNTGEPQYFAGMLLDLYNIHGTLEIYNNLYFNMRDDVMINNMSDTKIIKNANNRYIKNSNDAVSDLINFNSKLSGIGAR